MDKGLEALDTLLEDICFTKNVVHKHPSLYELKENANYKIIEKSFKELEELKKAFVSLSKEDEKTKKLLSLEIEKNRALEIIKEKRVDTLLLFRCFELDNLYGYSHFETYNQELYTQNITQEQYDLLKEVLL